MDEGGCTLTGMKVLHVIPSLSPAHGGPSVVLPVMAAALAAEGVEVDVATTTDDGPGRCLDAACGSFAQRGGFRVILFPKQTEFYKVSLPLLAWLLRHVADYDVVHVHAVFSFSTWAAGTACHLRGVPYVVRPLGVLNSWGMENRRRWLKAWSFRLADKPVLDRAAAMHYTSGLEAEDAERLGIRSRSVVIPLGMDLPPQDAPADAAALARRFPEAASRPLVLFLSRLDPKKNVEVLLQAMARLSALPSAPLLVIAGDGDPAYVAGLKRLASGLGLEGNVLWTGHLGGEDKRAALAAASLFVLPSRSENFGVALLEAMAAGLACISTPGVALALDAAKLGAVRLCEPEAGVLAEAIQTLLGFDGERERLGACAAETARRNYSMDGMARSLKALYQSITATR